MNLVRHKIGGGETWKAPLGVKRIKAIVQARTGNHVFAGAGHAGALQFSANLCWGYNANGQLGDNSVVTKSQPVSVTGFGSSSFTVVAAGTSDFSLALRLDGTLYSWGNGANGRLGSGATTPRSSPVAVSGSVSFLFASGYSAGGNAISNEGKLYGWGQNSKGEVGDNSTTQRLVPTLANSSTDWVKTAGGLNHVVGLRANGNLYTWGLNNSGQLGDNTVVAKSTPVAVFGSGVYRMLDKFVLKEVYIDVEPGREYQLTLGNAIVFGSEVIYYSTTERYNYEITLEYGT